MVRQLTPPGFDHAVRFQNIDLRKNALDGAIRNKLIYCAIHVFNARVHDRRGYCVFGESLCCFLEEFRCSVCFEGVTQSPRENATREVIGNRVKVHATAIEQSNDGCIDMSILIRLRRSQVHGTDLLHR